MCLGQLFVALSLTTRINAVIPSGAGWMFSSSRYSPVSQIHADGPIPSFDWYLRADAAAVHGNLNLSITAALCRA